MFIGVLYSGSHAIGTTVQYILTDLGHIMS